MSLTDVLDDEPRLYSAAHRCAGGWRRVLHDLGYDYRQFCRERPKWSVERVIRCILRRESSGQPLCATDVHRDDSKLRGAADRYFGSWSAALQASGIDAEAVSRTRTWTARRVVQRIRELGSQGAALNCSSVLDVDSGLVYAANGLFGSWDSALQESGYDPAVIRQRLPAWTRTTIVRAIQERAAAGKPVSFSKMVPRSAAMAGWRLFGSRRCPPTAPSTRTCSPTWRLTRRGICWDMATVTGPE